MAKVGYFILIGMIKYKVDKSWLILECHVLEIEIPELCLIPLKIKCGMCQAVLTSSVVAHPNIETIIDQDKSWSFTWDVKNEFSGISFHTMLQEDYWFLLFDFIFFLLLDGTWKAEQFQYIPILSRNFVLFEQESIFLAYLL